MKNKVLILGAGYIAALIGKEWKYPVYDGKITSYQKAAEIYAKYRPAVMINCIGHTGVHNVDDCELDKDKCILANTTVPVWLGEIAFRNPVKLVHISSGCIYHYDYKGKPVPETREPDYYTLFYSRTKIYAEAVLEELSKRCNILIARIRIPLDVRPHPRNLLTKLIEYKTIIDIPNSVSYMPDFIEMLKHLLKIDARGIFNCVNKGGLRYPDLLKAYQQHVGHFEYTLLPLNQLKLDRTNLLLSVEKLEKTGFKVRPIKDVLEECVKAYVKY